MKRRQWAILGGFAILALAVFFKNYLAASAEGKSPITRDQRKLISYQDLKAGSVALRIPIDGPVEALNKIEIYSEVTGIVGSQSQKFKEGKGYQSGEIMLHLENSEAQSNYQSTRSNYLSLLSQVLPDIKLDYPERFDTYYQYLRELNNGNGLQSPPKENNEKLRLFLSGRNVYSAYQNAEALRVRLSKYNIEAPFNGTVTDARVESGQLVRAGQILGEFIGKGQFEMISSLSPDEARLVQIGDSVQLSSTDGRRHYTGEVFRKNEKVDPSNQRISIYIRIEANNLNDGEYLKGSLAGQEIENAMKIDRKLLIDENSLFRIQDSSLVQQKVKVLHREPQSVIIEAPDSTLRLPQAKVTGAYTGMKIRLTKKQAE